MKERRRIVVEYYGSQCQALESDMDDIRQAVMRRDPMDEPIIYTEKIGENGEWQR
jgi:hypothetical protein